MNTNLGTLQLFSFSDRPDLVSDSVARTLSSSHTEGVGIAEIDPALSDTAAFCAHYNVRLDQAANCVVLEAKRADRTWFAACVIPGNTRADINGLTRRTLDARKVSFAPMEQAVAQTSMEYGAITPVGLPSDWSILVDKAVVDAECVIIGSGVRRSKLAVPGSFLASLPNVRILEGLGRIDPSRPAPHQDF